VRFTALKNELLQAIQVAAKAIPGSTTEPMLLNVLIEAEGSEARFFATDNRVSIRRAFTAEVAEAGSVALPGALFNELLQSLATTRSDQVHLTLGERFRLTIDCGSAHYEIGGHDPKGFPYVPPFEGETSFAIPSDDLRSLLRQVCVVGGAGFSGQQFDEVLIECQENTLTLVATDTVRLSIRHWHPEEGTLPEFDIRAPVHALQELGKVLGSDGETLIKVGKDSIAFHFQGTEFRARLSDKVFPNYRQILPKACSLMVELDTKEFTDALKGVLPLAREMKQKVHLHFAEDQVEILCVSPEVGRARRSIPAQIEGEPLELAFNARFMLDFLNVCKVPRVSFSATSSVHPSKLEPVGSGEDYIYILMPINL
jgi:DNA polymerase-3 subunit beta